jgi:ferrous iron transport protein A
MTLDAIPKDAIARVTTVAPGEQGIRLMEMGLVPGAPVRLVKTAPLGDPIQVCVRNYHLALRRSEARSIQVTLSPEVSLF